MGIESPIIPDKFLGELEPQASILPPEFFRQPQEGEIRQVEILGNNMVAVIKTDINGAPLYKPVVFSPDGRQQDIGLKRIGFNIAESIKFIQKHYNSYVRTSLNADDENLIGYGIRALQIQESQKSHIKSLISRLYPNDEYIPLSKYIEGLMSLNNPQFQEVKIISIPEKPDLLVLKANEITIIKQDNGQIKELEPRLALTVSELSAITRKENITAVSTSKKSGVTIEQLDTKIVNIQLASGENIRSFKTESFTLDEGDEPKLFFVSGDNKKIQWVDIEKVKAGIWKPEDVIIDLPDDTVIRKIIIDPNRNFLAVEHVQSSNKKQGRIIIIDKENEHKIFECGETTPNMTFDPQGNVIFVDSNNKLRKIQTNFSKIPSGRVEALVEARVKRLEEMAAQIQNLSLPEAAKREIRTIKANNEENLVKQLEVKITGLVQERIGQANTVEELEQLREQVALLAEDPQYQNYPQAFGPAERLILQKENGLRVASLEQQAAQIQIRLGEVTGLEEAAALRKEVSLLQSERTKASILDPEQRALIDGRLKTITEQSEQTMRQYIGQVSHSLETTLTSLQASLTTAINEAEVGQIYSDPSFVRFTTLIQYVQDPMERQAWQQKMTEAIAKQQRSILSQQAQIFGPERYQQASAQQISTEIFTELSRQIGIVKTNEDLRRFRSNPLVMQFYQQIGQLEAGVQQEAKVALERIMEEKRSLIESERELEKLRAGEVVRFNGIEFPVFTPPPPEFQARTIEVQPEGPTNSELQLKRLLRRTQVREMFARRATERAAKGIEMTPRPKTELFELEFVDNRGNVYKPKGRFSRSEYDRKLGEETVTARHYFETLPRHVPRVPPDWKMTPHYEKLLAKVADELNIQREMQEGIFILEGDAGTGKNTLIDVLAALSNREVFFVPCHAQMDKEDLTYTIEYDIKKGTVKKKSSLIEALSTPGAIVVFNEINTAPAGVVKMANPLTDYMRTLYVSFGEDKQAIRPDPSVLLIGVMNPQNYIGTKPLAQDFSSRATIWPVDYPPIEEEAAIIAAKVDSVKKLQLEEFQKLYQYVINGNAASGGDRFKTSETEKDVRALDTVAKVAAKIREAHGKFMRRESDEVVDFIFTPRDTRNIAIRYNRQKRYPASKQRATKDIILDTILPKIPDHEEQERVRTIVQSV